MWRQKAISSIQIIFPSGVNTRTRDPFRRDIALERMVVGSSVVLNNIFFESDSHLLLPGSMAELNRVLIFMKENPEL